jgi:hypothetical protein
VDEMLLEIGFGLEIVQTAWQLSKSNGGGTEQ